MALSSEDGLQAAFIPSVGSGNRPRTDWLALSVAILAPILIVHFCVVCPTTQQLAQMRGQVATLESIVQQLRDKSPAAAGAASLLASLTQQEELAGRAEATLARVAALNDRLAAQAVTLDQSAKSLDRLADVQSRIDQQGHLLERASGSLATLAALPAEIEDAIDRAGRAAPTVAKIDRLATRLSAADELAGQALLDVEIALDTQREVVLGAASLAAASETLEGLLELESRLNAPLMAVAAAHERLDALMRLKTSVIAQTEDLPEAFETLELMVALQTDYRRASGVFRTLQRLLADLVLLEPSISRVATAVQPILDRSSLSRLGGDELRLVLRELQARHSEATRELELAERAAAPTRAERIAARPTNSRQP
ncbi:hypothetical protein [Botrimarina hoheduenensis]|uniref:hypothetical protein n=1 Tax=Botrimarina hoheduenensis TaxID=2528000 RepID=UPI0011B48EAD|nr:hypothetical protein [Botrimarina hoheduenensis]